MLRLSVQHRLSVPQNAFSDAALTAYSLIKGKLKVVPGLFHVRLRHCPFPVTKETIRNIDYGLFLYDEITKPGWADRLKVFIELTSSELMKHERLDPKRASHIAEAVFLGWFVPRLTRNRDRLLGKTFPTLTGSPVRNGLKKFPMVQALWDRWKSLWPTHLSLESALHPLSPYHRDFMPIYRALTEQLSEPVVESTPALSASMEASR
jgi:hypothetical protein